MAEAGYRTVGELLLHLPSRYEDRRRPIAVSEVAVSGPASSEVREPGRVTLRGRLTGVRAVRVRRRRLSLVRGVLRDDSGELPVIWFNRPYLPARVEEEVEYLLHGEIRPAKGGGLELVNPSCERATEALHGGRVVPVYPRAGGLGAAALRRILPAALAAADPPRGAPEPLPRELLRRRDLPPLGEALQAVHAPEEEADVELLNRRRSPGHLRLIYGELLELQLELALLRARQVGRPKGRSYRVDRALRQRARELLPFRLTAAQKRVVREIVDDLRSPQPMLRLLQGDVGSGKTIVAALALLVVLESGYQGAFMAPTELLAEQHFQRLRRLLGRRFRLALVTASAAGAEAGRRALAQGEVALAVGTHALIQEAVEIPRLGLAVIDEQHRFGVAQRRLLGGKGERPDLLVMTATPIPRSLALTAYGDLELSLLDELPPGRRPVATEVLPASRREEVYRRLGDELAAGGRAYVVFPLIEESERVEAASLAALGAQVRARFAGVPSAVVHGRLPAEERERVMAAFAAGRVRLLVATTVIEVGVDVPEATWMVIEGAERFGLAQLHQLRGRVGRGERPACCVALHGSLSEGGRRRLELFARIGDGFEIAEADLALRGPGELLGTRQAGMPELRVADLAADRRWLLAAREDARRLLPRLEEPAFASLRRRLEPRVARRWAAFQGG